MVGPSQDQEVQSEVVHWLHAVVGLSQDQEVQSHGQCEGPEMRSLVACLIKGLVSTNKRVRHFPFMKSLRTYRGWNEINRRSAREPMRGSN